MEDSKCTGVHRDTFNENALYQIENVLRKKDTNLNEDEDRGIYRDALNENALREKESESWKEIQQNTYKRWINVKLNPLNMQVDDLQMDLMNGLNLIALVEVLSGKKLPKYNKKPNFRSQKLENISIVFKFLAGEGIFLFNIDSSDIVDGKLKLILSLLWNIILHYEILVNMNENEGEEHSNDKKTSKQRLMEWVNQKMPNYPVTNFTSNWNDGKSLGCLVHSICPKLCSDWEQWDVKQPIVNATLAMNIAEKRLNVPKLLRPDEIANPKVDEHSVMTYLSQFKKVKFKTGAPKRQKIKDVNKEEYRKILDFLMIAGLDEKVLSNPKKAQRVKEWVESHNVYKLMDRKAVKSSMPTSNETKNITEAKDKKDDEGVDTGGYAQVDDQQMSNNCNLKFENSKDKNEDLSKDDKPEILEQKIAVDKPVPLTEEVHSTKEAMIDSLDKDINEPKPINHCSTSIDESTSNDLTDNSSRPNISGELETSILPDRIKTQEEFSNELPVENSTISVVENLTGSSDETSTGALPPPPPPPPPSNMISQNLTPRSERKGNKNTLLDEISSGIKLKPVDENPRFKAMFSNQSNSSLDELMMDALARFREDISFSDDDEWDGVEDEDSDWSVDE